MRSHRRRSPCGDIAEWRAAILEIDPDVIRTVAGAIDDIVLAPDPIGTVVSYARHCAIEQDLPVLADIHRDCLAVVFD